MLGVQGRGTSWGPETKDFGFNDIDNIDRDVVDFELLQHNWRLVFERNGEFLGVTVEALDDVLHCEVYATFQLIQVGEEVLVEQHFAESFHNGQNKVGSTKFFSWEEFTKPSRGIVQDDQSFVRIKMHMDRGCGLCSNH